MAYGVKALRKLQFGRETTAGSAVAATTVFRGEGVIKDTRKVEFPTEDVGYIGGVTRNYSPLLGAELKIPATPATFEQLPHIFEMGIISTSGVRDSAASSDYIYTYPLPTTQNMFLSATSSALPIKSYTIQGGDNNQAEVMEFSHVTDFELNFKAGEALMVSATIAGRQVALTTFTAALTPPTVYEILGSKAKLYIDAIAGTIGTTQITGELLSAKISVKTGLQAVNTADGNLYFTFVKGVAPEVIWELVFEHSTNALAEKVFWRSGTARLFQLKFESPTALTTPGTTYTYKTLKCNLAGLYESFSELGDQDGDDILTAKIRGGYNSTAAQFASFVVVNELSTIP